MFQARKTNVNSPIAKNEVDEVTSKNKELDEFVYIVSHDLRNAARALVDIPQWIQEDVAQANLELPSPITDHLDHLTRLSKRLDQMLEDLLTYSRIGRGNVASEVAPIDILKTLLDKKSFNSRFHISSSLTDLKILISEADLETLFHCIISNAIKHSDLPNGTILISDYIEDGYVMLLFSDDGPGIAPLYHEKIFQMMTTLKSRDRVEGSGIGLAICKKICEENGGEIWINSEPPLRGSVFGVVLPLN